MKHNLSPPTDTEEGQFRFLSIYSKNREEWVITDFACILSGITVVTLYDTLGKEAIDFILDQTYMKTVVLTADKVKNLVDLKKEGKITKTTHIIYFDELKQADIDAAVASGLTVVKYEDALSEGRGIPP